MKDDRELVGCLEVRLKGADPHEQPVLIDIYGNEKFYLGRDAQLCRHYWSDPTISKRHLRIHCLLYEKDTVSNIPPFIYATDLSSNGTYLKKSNYKCPGSQGEIGVLMGPANGSFLLDDGDELWVSDNIRLVYHGLTSVDEHQFTWTQEREKQTFADRYLLTGRLIGKGGYGKVLVGRHHKTRRQLACKVINLRGLYDGIIPPSLRSLADQTQDSFSTSTRKQWPSKVMRCFREFDVLKDLSHPNIISIEKVFWSSNTIYIFEELITGGDLFSYIEYKGGRLLDVEAAVIVRQILIGVEYLHSHNIVHRDLKPDNVLMTSVEDGARIVITDFGNARYLPKGTGADKSRSASKSRMFSLVGTLEFAAPEIHQMNPTFPSGRGYSKAVDMWSIGCITAALLTGDVIFTDRGHPEYEANPLGVIMELAGKCDTSIIDDRTNFAWRRVGYRPKDFVKHLLVLREADRMTVTQALAHPWFSNPRHASEFKALYERTIENWQPRRKKSNLVEPIRSEGAEAGQLQENPSHHFLLTSLSRTSSSLHELSTYPRRRTFNKQLSTVAEEHEENYFERSGDYEQHSHDTNTDGSNRARTTVQMHRESSIPDSIKPLSLDSVSPASDPPASGMYSIDDLLERYAYDENTNVEVEDSQGSIDSRPPVLETQWDSSIVYETPVEVAKRPPSPGEVHGNTHVPFKQSKSSASHTVSKRRKLASKFY